MIPKTQRQLPDLPASVGDLHAVAGLVPGEPLEEARISGLDVSGQKLTGLTAKCCLFEGTTFARCTIPSPRFRDIRLIRCDLSNATLRGFEATRVEFVDCRLTGMIAIECSWQDVLVENCDGSYAQLSHGKLHRCEFKRSNCSEADFRSSDLKDAAFPQAVLTRADFSHAQLRGADFRGAAIEGILVGPEDVRGAIVSPTQAMELARLLGLIVK